METFLLVSSITYLLGAIWYILVDRRDKRRVIVIPTEFIFVIAVVFISLFFLSNAQKGIVFYPGFETKLLIISAITGFVMLCIHGITKNLDDRHDLKKLSKSTRNIIRAIHLSFSHQVIYISLMMVLLAFALGEINNTIVLAVLPKIKIVSLSALIFALAFYRNLIHGNTWRAEIVAIPLAVVFLASTCLQNNVFLIEYPLVYFCFLTLILTFLFLIIDIWREKLKFLRKR